MIDRDQLEDLMRRVLEPTGWESPVAVRLLLGTAAQESGLGSYLRQMGGGPALGIFQMEPATERDIWANWLAHRGREANLVRQVTGRSGPGPWLEWDLAYQIVMCRLHYLRVPKPLPPTLEGQARYWKEFYNTPGGAGTVEEYLANARRHGI